MISFYILLKLIRDIYLFPPIPYTSVLIVLNQECILYVSVASRHCSFIPMNNG